MLHSTWQHGNSRVFIGFYRWNHMWIDKHGQVMISTDINTIEYENNYTGLLMVIFTSTVSLWAVAPQASPCIH